VAVGAVLPCDLIQLGLGELALSCRVLLRLSRIFLHNNLPKAQRGAGSERVLWPQAFPLILFRFLDARPEQRQIQKLTARP